MYTYKATLDRVVDGDTVDLNIDLGFHVWFNSTRVRLRRVDTPEKRTKDLLEKHFGLLASDFVLDKLINAKKITVRTVIDGRQDKYGRILGEIHVDDESMSLNDQLIEKRYAVSYEGQNKSSVAAQHINNYQYLVENGEVLTPELQELFEKL